MAAFLPMALTVMSWLGGGALKILRVLMGSEVGRIALAAAVAFCAGTIITEHRRDTRDALARAEAIAAAKDRDLSIGASAALRMEATTKTMAADLEAAQKRIAAYEDEVSKRKPGARECVLDRALDGRLRGWK